MSLKILTAKQKGYYLEFNGKALSSKFNPIEQSEKLINTVKTHREKKIIILGIGNLYFIRWLNVNKFNFFIYEEQPLIQEFIFKENELLKYHLKIEDYKKKLFNDYSFLTVEDSLEHIFIFNNGFSGKENIIRREILNQLQLKKVQIRTENYFQNKWIDNSLKNLKFSLNNPSIYLVNQYLRKKKLKKSSTKAIFLSSGVLKTKEMEYLIAISSQLDIYCVAGVVPWCITQGIQPTAIISTDGGFPNDYHFRHIFHHQIPLICSFQTLHHIIKNYLGPIYFFFNDEFFFEALKKTSLIYCDEIKILLNDNFFFMAPSVIHTALSLLKYLEYEDIELMGAGLFLEPFRSHQVGNSIEEYLFNKCDRLKTYESLFHNIYFSQVKKIEKHKYRGSNYEIFDEALKKGNKSFLKISGKSFSPEMIKNTLEKIYFEANIAFSK